mmetsp:Transcript_19436/g.55525  ORF Transcript_19436/g.55525 Transcript_19436/m.55525 type:complete len:243 (-) Transcript_19436:661-1389(-)
MSCPPRPRSCAHTSSISLKCGLVLWQPSQSASLRSPTSVSLRSWRMAHLPKFSRLCTSSLFALQSRGMHMSRTASPSRQSALSSSLVSISASRTSWPLFTCASSRFIFELPSCPRRSNHSRASTRGSLCTVCVCGDPFSRHTPANPLQTTRPACSRWSSSSCAPSSTRSARSSQGRFAFPLSRGTFRSAFISLPCSTRSLARLATTCRWLTCSSTCSSTQSSKASSRSNPRPSRRNFQSRSS